MENKELISVVVPVYNVEKYVSYCIESIINQKYKNLEIILVDDGSTDKSGKICDDYSKIDNRIKVIHKKNGGLADARNVGIDCSTGEYIGFVDSDDYIHHDFYETLYNLIKENKADISECQFLRVDVENIDNVCSILNEKNSKLNYEVIVDNNIECLRKLYGPRLNPYIKKVVVWNKLYKKELFENTQFPVGRLHEDEFTTYKIIYKCNKMASTNMILHGYMQTKNSIMRKEIRQKRINDNLEAYEESARFFNLVKNKELEYKVIRRYLENCIELSGKVYKEQSDDKDDKLTKIFNLFEEHYNLYFQDIKDNVNDSRENEIINLIQDAKSDRKFSYINPVYWKYLEKIINKK